MYKYDGIVAKREIVRGTRCSAAGDGAFQSVLESPGVEKYIPLTLDTSNDRTGRGIFLQGHASKGTVLVEIPLGMCICVDYQSASGLSVPMDGVSSEVPWPRLNKAVAKDDALPWDVLISLGVLDAISGMGSACLQLYGNEVLPGAKDICLPLCMPEGMLCELQDDTMERKAMEQKKRLQELFPGLGVPMEDDGPTWMEYAFGCVRSRAFSCGDGRYAFVPILDAANHALEPNADFSYDPNTRKILLFAVEDISRGEEVTISYTGKVGYTNARMMSQYGFVLENGNPFDRYSLEEDLGMSFPREGYYPINIEHVQRALGNEERMVDILSGKDAYSYACLKSLPINMEDSAPQDEQTRFLCDIQAAVSKRIEEWKSTLRDDESMLAHMQASDKSDLRLQAATRYRIESKKRDLAMHQLLTDLLVS